MLKSFTSPRHIDLPKVQVSRQAMVQGDLEEGSIVELRGGRSCGGVVSQSYMVDDDCVRLPGFLMRNAGVIEGSYVSVKKVSPPEAQLVVMGFSSPPRKEFLDYLRERLIGTPLSAGDIVPVRTVFGSPLYFSVVAVEPRRLLVVGRRTIVTVKAASKTETLPREESRPSTGSGSPLLAVGVNLGVGSLSPPQTVPSEREPLQITIRENMPVVRFEDVGGLSEQISQVREMIELPLRHPAVFKHFGIRPPRGVLFVGPPGTGKTLLAKAVACSVNANVFVVNGPEVISKWYGDSEARLRELFSNAKKAAPSVIIFDEVDSLAPKRSEGESRDLENRVVSTLLSLMDGLEDRGDVVVIGSTNNPDGMDPALRRPGRFDREIFFPAPDANGRFEVFKIHTRHMPLAKNIDLVSLAGKTHGMTGSDIEAICRDAALNAIRRGMYELKERPEALSSMIVESEDFNAALEKMTPSSLREWLTFTVEVSQVDIGGLSDVKARLMEAIILPLREPDRYRKMGIEPVKGVLLYGPPGTGKTMLCRWIASETESNTILVNSTEMVSKLMGESERNIRRAFEAARGNAPCILVFDEIDAICPKRDAGFGEKTTSRMVNAFLTEMDGLQPLRNVVVIGTTNRVDILDPALLRPGRFDLKMQVPYPDEDARAEVFRVATRKIPLAANVDVASLAKNTEGFSGADIMGLCREAALGALRKGVSEVSAEDFYDALKVAKSRNNEDKMGV